MGTYNYDQDEAASGEDRFHLDDLYTPQNDSNVVEDGDKLIDDPDELLSLDGVDSTTPRSRGRNREYDNLTDEDRELAKKGRDAQAPAVLMEKADLDDDLIADEELNSRSVEPANEDSNNDQYPDGIDSESRIGWRLAAVFLACDVTGTDRCRCCALGCSCGRERRDRSTPGCRECLAPGAGRHQPKSR